MDTSSSRRAILRTTGVAGATALAGCPVGFGGTGDSSAGERDWLEYRFDAGNAAVHPSAPGPGGDLSLAWTANYRSEADRRYERVGVHGQPVVVDGTVVASAYRITGEEQFTVVAAFDLESGERQWDRTFPVADADTYPDVSPSLTIGSDGQRVFVETVTDELTLTALSPADGATEWTQSLEWQLRSALTVADGSLLAGEQLYAVHDAEDGTRESRYTVDWEGEELPWTSQYPPTVAEDTIYVPAFDELHAVDRESGERRWTATNDFFSIAFQGSPPFNPPVVADGVAYVTVGFFEDFRDTGGMLALDTDDGSVLWTTLPDGTRVEDFEGGDFRNQMAALYGMPVLLDGTLYGHGMEHGEWGLFAIDPADGSIERLSATGGHVGADGLLYGLAGDDEAGATVRAIDPDADEVVGTATVEGWDPVAGSYHAVAGEYLVISTIDGIAAFGPN